MNPTLIKIGIGTGAGFILGLTTFLGIRVGLFLGPYLIKKGILKTTNPEAVKSITISPNRLAVKFGLIGFVVFSILFSIALFI